MSWYKTGTVAINNASTAVAGTGTAWVDNVDVGEGILLPDGRIYEITGVVSNTSLTIGRAYLGANTSGQPYEIQPFRGRIAGLTARAGELLDSFQAVRDGIGAGLFPDGSAELPGFRFANDQDTGFFRPANNMFDLVTGGVSRMRVHPSGNVGVGSLVDAGFRLDLQSGAACNMRVKGASGSAYYITRGDSDGTLSAFGDRAAIVGGTANGAASLYTGPGIPLVFDISNTEVMRVAASGFLGVGTTTPVSKVDIAGPTSGGGLTVSGSISATRESSMVIDIGDGNRIMAIGAGATPGTMKFILASSASYVTAGVFDTNGTFRPGVDNNHNLGTGSFRFGTVFAATGTINTSDERDKNWRGELNAAELRAAKRIIGELGIYQWNDAVAEKGEDGARLHFGVRAQQAFAIMEDEGLDWGRYAWACYDQWEEQTEPVMVEVDEAYEETEMQPTGETRVTLEAGDRYGIRPDQLAFWLIAAQAKIQEDLEARIAALEAA